MNFEIPPGQPAYQIKPNVVPGGRLPSHSSMHVRPAQTPCRECTGCAWRDGGKPMPLLSYNGPPSLARPQPSARAASPAP